MSPLSHAVPCPVCGNSKTKLTGNMRQHADSTNHVENWKGKETSPRLEYEWKCAGGHTYWQRAPEH